MANLITIRRRLLLLHLLSAAAYAAAAPGPCFTSLFSFGDSTVDTGNQMLMPAPEKRPHCCFPPYGETYFGRPTGRCSDGRMIVDFIAEKLGFPLLTPFPGRRKSPNFVTGANFAEANATALDSEILNEKGILNTNTNTSLRVELGRFKELLATLCSSPSECKDYLSKSLILLGEIGGNDYNRAYYGGTATIDQIIGLIPFIVATIGDAIQELVELGASTILVPGNFPIGCAPKFRAVFGSSNREDYDRLSGCLVLYNNITQQHNHHLQTEIVRLRELHPEANIMYADYFNSAIRFFQYPERFGFTGSVEDACCGGAGPYNYNASAICGYPGSRAYGEDPSTYVNWDDHHMTEAANRLVADSVLEGSFSVPRFDSSCIVGRASGDARGFSAY